MEKTVNQDLKQNNSQRNSILEILRLCASLWVMYYHGYSLITRSEVFRNGRIAVDFFFVLSGFFFLSAFEKHKQGDSLFKDTMKFTWKKFKPMMVTFFLCFSFSLIGYIKFYDGFFNSSIWGYLWYIPHLLLVFGVYYFLRRIIKNKIIFNALLGITAVVCFSITLTGLNDYGLFRGFAGVAVGILLSQIPPIWNAKKGKVVAVSATILSFAAIFVIALLHPDMVVQDCLCILLLFPSIVYFASQIPFSNKYINGACSISLGLYTYQTFVGLLEDCKILTSGRILFLIVLTLAVVDVVIKKVVKVHLKKKGLKS